MKSRITIEVDFEHGNTPIIQILKFNNDGEVQEDVRDKLISYFLETLGYTSSWAKVAWVQNYCIDGRTVHQRINITPITPDKLQEEAEIMLERSEEHTSELQSHSDLVCRL